MILAFVDVEFEKLCDVKTQLKTSTEYIPDLIVSFEKVLSIEGTLIEEAAEELLTKTIRAKVMKNMQNTKKVLKSLLLVISEALLFSRLGCSGLVAIFQFPKYQFY